MIILIPIFLALYFVPTMVAYWRGKRNKAPVFVVNLFFGFTFFGWVIALLMAVSKDKHVFIHQVN